MFGLCRPTLRSAISIERNSSRSARPIMPFSCLECPDARSRDSGPTSIYRRSGCLSEGRLPTLDYRNDALFKASVNRSRPSAVRQLQSFRASNALLQSRPSNHGGCPNANRVCGFTSERLQQRLQQQEFRSRGQIFCRRAARGDRDYFCSNAPASDRRSVSPINGM